MNDWQWRAGICIFIVGMLFVPSIKKPNSIKAQKPAPFLRYTTGYMVVRVIDSGGSEALHRFPDGAIVSDVKNMTQMKPCTDLSERGAGSQTLKNGDIVDLSNCRADGGSITVRRMPVTERIVLGLPLNPDVLSVDEWMLLPGIGRSLAEAIILDRQKNGDYRSIDSILRVPGIGSKKALSLKKFF